MGPDRRRRRRLACGALLAGALAGCEAAPAPRACTVEQVASLEAAPGVHLVVPGRLNQAEVQFALDTGAEGSLVTPEAARHSGLAESRSTTRVIGVGGVLMASNVFANIELGGLEVRRQVPAVSLPIRSAEGAVAGLIGSDLLSQYDLEVSLPEHRVRLWRVGNCSGDYARWAGPHWTVPLRRTSGGRLIADASVDGVALRAVLDTGAAGMLVSAEGARRAGATGLAHDPLSTGVGADGNVTERHRHRFASLAIGPETFHDPLLPVMVGDLTQGDMLLGMDWFRHRRVWISWSTRQMFVQPERAIEDTTLAG